MPELDFNYFSKLLQKEKEELLESDALQDRGAHFF